MPILICTQGKEQLLYYIIKQANCILRFNTEKVNPIINLNGFTKGLTTNSSNKLDFHVYIKM